MTTTHNFADSSAVVGHSKSSVSSVQMTFGYAGLRHEVEDRAFTKLEMRLPRQLVVQSEPAHDDSSCALQPSDPTYAFVVHTKFSSLNFCSPFKR